MENRSIPVYILNIHRFVRSNFLVDLHSDQPEPRRTGRSPHESLGSTNQPAFRTREQPNATHAPGNSKPFANRLQSRGGDFARRGPARQIGVSNSRSDRKINGSKGRSA